MLFILIKLLFTLILIAGIMSRGNKITKHVVPVLFCLGTSFNLVSSNFEVFNM